LLGPVPANKLMRKSRLRLEFLIKLANLDNIAIIGSMSADSCWLLNRSLKLDKSIYYLLKKVLIRRTNFVLRKATIEFKENFVMLLRNEGVIFLKFVWHLQTSITGRDAILTVLDLWRERLDETHLLRIIRHSMLS